jgi:hypothetical protein
MPRCSDHGVSAHAHHADGGQRGVGGRITRQSNGLMEARAESDIVAALLTVKTTGALVSNEGA